MKREIKFRGFNPATQEIVSWEGMQGWSMGGLESPNIMQYTGLKDKNGKEIYEGDIMRVLDRDWSDVEKDTKTFIVYYAEDAFILTTQVGIKERESENPNQYNKDWIEAKLSRKYGRDRFEIIGNVYENPNLLQDSTKRAIV